MKLSIITRHPIPTQEGGFETEAWEHIEGETVEQLVSRVLYDMALNFDGHGGSLKPVLKNMAGTFHDVIEIRLVRE